jgi:hypothetical protein
MSGVRLGAEPVIPGRVKAEWNFTEELELLFTCSLEKSRSKQQLNRISTVTIVYTEILFIGLEQFKVMTSSQ